MFDMNFLRGLVHITSADRDTIRDATWSQGTADWQNRPSDYSHALLEQYKTCVEMADRISVRRMLANTFFLTVNTAAMTLFGVFWQDQPRGDSLWLAFPLIALLAETAAWFILLRSYRQLNTAKYIVIGILEEQLPASPYWRAEWKALGEGQDPTRYIPLSHIEQWVPVVFALTYIGSFLAALIA